MGRWRRGTVAAALLGAVWLLPAPLRAAEPDDTRALMHEIFAAFATLVRHVEDPEAFASPEAREDIVGSLRALERNAQRLETHGGPVSAAHRPVGESLVSDAARALDALTLGQFESARFLSAQLVEDCFACHSKLPTHHRFAHGAELLESPAVASLPPERKALVAVAARQFETALSLLESYMADPRHPAVEIALSGAFESYLKVALRVLGDRDRALRTLTAFRGRSEVPVYLDSELSSWIETLRELDPAEPTDRLLARARDQIEQARMLVQYPGDRRGLVHFVVASRWLHQSLEGRTPGREELSETMLLLGLCEIHISSSRWVSEAESFLAGAIRAAPEGASARTAYGTLEAVYLEGYTGSGGTHLPPMVERRLSSLRALLENGPSPAGGVPR